MNKVAIVYWSGTGNTEQMAQAVAEGVKNAGGEADVLTCAEFDSAKLADYGAVAFGCPAMGAEQLEESEFEPMFSGLEGSLNGKKIALFGSYVVDKAFLRLEVKAHYVAVVLFRTLCVNGKPFPFSCRILHTVGMYHGTVEVHFYAFGLQLHVFVFNVAFTV